MSARCYTIDVDGEPAVGRFTREPTEQDVEAFRALIRAVRARADELLPPDAAERQAAARERLRARTRRILEENR